MYSKIIYLVLFLFPVVGFSQFNTSLDFVASYDRSSASPSQSFAGKPRANYRVGANFNFRVYEKVMMKTGLRFTQLGLNRRIPFFISGSTIVSTGNSNIIFSGDPDSMSQGNTIVHYLEIPLVGRYEFHKKKFTLYTELGIATHLFLNSSTKLENNGGPTTNNSVETIDYDRFMLGIISGLGFNYLVSDKVQLFVQKSLRIYPGVPTYFSREITEYSLGLEVGVRRALSIGKF